MAHNAVVYTMGRIKHLLTSTTFPDVPCFREILEFAYEELLPLEGIAERIFWSGSSTLDLEIETTVWRLDDVIEQIVSRRWSDDADGGVDSSTALLDLKQEIQSSIKALKEYIEEYNHPLPDEEEDDVISSRIDFCGNKSEKVGLSDKLRELKKKLMSRGTHSGPGVVSILGMPGIDKTTLAKETFEDPEIMQHFDCRVWVKVGKNCQLNDIPRRVLAELDPGRILEGGDEDSVRRGFNESLKGKRYLIVLDDVWNKYMAYNLNPSIQSRTKEFKLPFPDEENGSQVLLTTRLKQVNTVNDQFRCEVLRMRLLNQEESWELLREKVFAKEFCPPQLEEVGKKIAKKCEGLPLTILAVADLLSKLEKTLLHWNEVAEQKNHQIFMVAYEKISKVLLRSYEHLPRVLKMCFLYMGIFPQTHKITRSKLINMWNIDGFLEQNELKIPSLGAKECLEELISNSLVMIIQYTLFSTVIVEGEKKMKTCKLHSSMWYLSNREAKKTKFSHILDVLDDGLEDMVRNQCQLSFHNNVLLGIKDLHKSLEENCASTARSLLCYGPYHQYQVPLCFGLGMLKLLDALTIRLYEFPTEVQKLIELRYLALTLNGKLPSSISLLSNLEFLIINRHMSVKTSRSASYLPAEIWKFKIYNILKSWVMTYRIPLPALPWKTY